MASVAFQRETSEESFAEYVDFVRNHADQRDGLLSLLTERNPLYDGRSSGQSARMRGYLLAAFETAGLCDQALPYVLEELQSGHKAYLVAAAAKALRGLPSPSANLTAFLLKAIENIHLIDDVVSFEKYLPSYPLASPTTALTEIFRTLAWMGSEAAPAVPSLDAMLGGWAHQFPSSIQSEIRAARDHIVTSSRPARKPCCSMATLGVTPVPFAAPARAPISNVAFEDQDGVRLCFDEFFRGVPSVVVFFYTRCDNPEKCSLTIGKLAMLQREIGRRSLAGALKTAAITYDPEYDLPQRLRAYGENRGVIFDAHNRMLRALTNFDLLRSYFDLGVSYTGSTVNHHRIELFVVDSAGGIRNALAHLQWTIDKALELASGVSRHEAR